ncbi:hypothetical protein BCR34DRAFT_571111 [Clohesyomyces aquaticus]|uniref:Uncharacterized protein n=1 Tax=Clohesyomyces aquaticus TaxID=1231657 RepID=A0A1Y1Z928_9PLEO|nr:hypothetical protein BCR34DRAFT_571111 [Clohesyomyces aquaticus]
MEAMLAVRDRQIQIFKDKEAEMENRPGGILNKLAEQSQPIYALQDKEAERKAMIAVRDREIKILQNKADEVEKTLAVQDLQIQGLRDEENKVQSALTEQVQQIKTLEDKLANEETTNYRLRRNIENQRAIARYNFERRGQDCANCEGDESSVQGCKRPRIEGAVAHEDRGLPSPSERCDTPTVGQGDADLPPVSEHNMFAPGRDVNMEGVGDQEDSELMRKILRENWKSLLGRE